MPTMLQTKIAALTDLDETAELYNSLDTKSLSVTDENALTSLPTFGGPEPSSTNGIASWDETRFLTVQGELIDRESATWLPEYADADEDE